MRTDYLCFSSEELSAQPAEEETHRHRGPGTLDM